MEKTYILKGLNCANCANKIQYAIQNTPGINTASLSFATSTLKLQTAANYSNNITKQIKHIVHKYEPDVEVIEKTQGQNIQNENKHSGKAAKSQVLLLGFGAALFAAAVILNNVFSLNIYVSLAIFLLAYFVLGGNVLLKAAKNISKGQIFDENFLMSIATIGAFAIGDFAEGVAVMLFYQIGEYFQNMAVGRSRKSIASLMDIRPDYANILKSGSLTKVAPDEVEIGQIIVVKPGEKVPLDGKVIKGTSMLNTSALTGEAVPRSVKVDDEVLSGMLNLNGVLEIKVTKTFANATVTKIIELVENASSKKAPTENFITKFSRYYTPVVVILAVLLATIPPLFFGGGVAQWLNRGLIFLVISCPCALVISIPLGFFGGIGAASRKGVLVKGGNYLHALTQLKTVVFDKTGTLTKAVFAVNSITPHNGFSKEEVLKAAAYAEAFSNHPIAKSIREFWGKEIKQNKLQNYKETPGRGVSAQLNGQLILAGNNKLMQANGIAYVPQKHMGTQVFVAINGVFAGDIIISDEIKENSYSAIAALKKRGVQKTVMLTGDSDATGQAVAAALKLDEVYTQLLPEQKVQQLEIINAKKPNKSKLAFVGDGINDAPVLARADIGIAMGGLGSDAAIEAADIVLMTDDPLKIATAMDVAKKTQRIVWQNIIFALFVKAIFLLMGAFGYTSMWAAVFADVGVAVLAILNAMRLLKG